MPAGFSIDYFDSIGVDGKPQQRRYMLDGTRTVSVSTVAKYIDPDADGLLYWATGLTYEGIAELADLLDDTEWLRSRESIEAALKEAELTWHDLRSKAAVRGTNVHELILAALAENRTLPSLAKLTEDERAYGQAVMRWWTDRRPRPILTEQMVASAEHGFAGRFDLLCEIDGETVLVDAKTRGKGVPRLSDHVQLAGYAIASEESGFPAPDRQLALILTPEGEPVECDGLAEPDDFLAALDVYRRKASLGKLMRSQAKAAA